MEKSGQERAAAGAAFLLMETVDVLPTPDNFALFYSYALGERNNVTSAIREILANKQRFTTAVLDDLHTRAPTGAGAQAVIDTVGKEMTDVLTSVLGNIEAMGRDAEAYGQTLFAVSDQLGNDEAPVLTQKLVTGLIGATRTMEARSKALEEELQRSSLEVLELKTQLDNVRKESLIDPLTGIHNRKAFDTDIASAIALSKKGGAPLSLLMCDIDHFKTFNDKWGHQIGDQVLRAVATCLAQNVKGRDTAARYGGEEFAVILRHTGLDEAKTLADQIRSNVETRKLVRRSTGDLLSTITISIGVAQFVVGDTDTDLIRRADACLYEAKHAGRNCVVGERTLPKRIEHEAICPSSARLQAYVVQ